MRNFRLPPRCRWNLLSSAILRNVHWTLRRTFRENISVPSPRVRMSKDR